MFVETEIGWILNPHPPSRLKRLILHILKFFRAVGRGIQIYCRSRSSLHSNAESCFFCPYVLCGYIQSFQRKPPQDHRDSFPHPTFPSSSVVLRAHLFLSREKNIFLGSQLVSRTSPPCPAIWVIDRKNGGNFGFIHNNSPQKCGFLLRQFVTHVCKRIYHLTL